MKNYEEGLKYMGVIISFKEVQEQLKIWGKDKLKGDALLKAKAEAILVLSRRKKYD